jgi:hypothetical protein
LWNVGSADQSEDGGEERTAQERAAEVELLSRARSRPAPGALEFSTRLTADLGRLSDEELDRQIELARQRLEGLEGKG